MKPLVLVALFSLAACTPSAVPPADVPIEDAGPDAGALLPARPQLVFKDATGAVVGPSATFKDAAGYYWNVDVETGQAVPTVTYNRSLGGVVSASSDCTGPDIIVSLPLPRQVINAAGPLLVRPDDLESFIVTAASRLSGTTCIDLTNAFSGQRALRLEDLIPVDAPPATPFAPPLRSELE